MCCLSAVVCLASVTHRASWRYQTEDKEKKKKGLLTPHGTLCSSMLHLFHLKA